MLSVNLKISLVIALICYFVIILMFLKNKAITLKYTLLWLFAGIVFVIFVAVPESLVWLRCVFGIEDNMNALFLMFIAFILTILMSITSIVSKQTERIRTLVQQQAIMEKRIRELEEKSK